MRILIIDDDPVIRDTMTMLLMDTGCTVASRADGRGDAVMPDGTDPDLLIADILMPNVQGTSLIRKTRSEKPNIKIIAMTAGGTVLREQLRRTSSQIGAHAVLAKPFSADELSAKVTEVSGMLQAAYA